MKTRLMCLFFALMFCLPMPLMAQQSSSFPFNEVQQLTPEQVKIQKYKLQRLRLNQVRGEWTIIRGINEKIDDVTLLKMVQKTDIIEIYEMNQAIGNSVALAGLGLVAGGGLIMTDVISFSNSFLVGLGIIIAGGAMALGGEMWAGNIGNISDHLLDRTMAEVYVGEYNQNLKKELGLENLPNLE